MSQYESKYSGSQIDDAIKKIIDANFPTTYLTKKKAQE